MILTFGRSPVLLGGLLLLPTAAVAAALIALPAPPQVSSTPAAHLHALHRKFIEFQGVVQDDGSLQEHNRCVFSDNFDMDLYNEAVSIANSSKAFY